MSGGYSASGFRQGVKFRAPRPAGAGAAAAAERVSARRALMAEINRRSNYGGPSHGFSGAPRQGRQRLLEHKTFDAISNVTTSMAFDVGVAATPFAPVAGATMGCINQVPVGNSSITRVGRRINITAVALRGQISSNSTTNVTHGAILLVWDRHPNKSVAIPPWNNILVSQGSDTLTNKDYAPRFKILRRWDYAVCGNLTAGQTTGSGLCVVDEFVKLKNKVTIWDPTDTTGLYPTMQEGALLLATTSDDNSTNAPVAILSSRIYYQDS